MEREALLALGTLLRQRREQRGLTQEELAEETGAGLSVDTVSNIERGRTRPYRQTLEALIAALGLAEAERETILRVWREAKRPGAWQHEPAAVPQTVPRGGAELLPTADPAGAVASRRSSSQPVVDRPARSPLVGRASELELLERHLGGEGPPLLLLAGEPGIGKSRLLREAIERGRADGYTVLAGGCQRRSGEEPYAPLVETLAQHLERLEVEQRRASLQECGWLVRLLPELLEAGEAPLPPTSIAPGQERRLVFGAVSRFLRNVAGAEGTLLVLDDLQWAGSDAVDLLGTLIGSASAGRLRVAGAYRDTEVSADSPLAALLADLAHAGLVRRLGVHPLTEEAAGALLAAMLGEAEGGEGPERSHLFKQHVVQRTGGVPFFLVSCIQSLQTGTLRVDQPDALPWDLTQALRQRIAALPAESREVLVVAAVVGREVLHGLLATVCDLTEPALLAALDAALQSGLLVEGEDYRFAHDVIREVVEADLGPGRRMTLHRRIAEVLEGRAGDPPVELLAYHYRRSDRDDKAVHYLELAGDRARAQYGYAAAEDQYRDLVERLVRLGRGGESARAYEKLGETLHVAGRYDEALQALEEAAERYRLDHELDGEARAVAQIGQVCHRQGRVDEGIARLSEVAARLDRSDEVPNPPRNLWRVWMALSANFNHSGRYGEALETAERAVRLARAAGDAYALAETEMALGAGLLPARSAGEALPVLEEAVRLGEEVGALEAVRVASYFAAAAHLAQGRFKRSQACGERALAAAEHVGDPGWVALISSELGFCLFHQGEWSEAQVYLECGAEMAGRLGPSFISLLSPAYLGQFYLGLGAWDEAARLLDEALRMAEHLPWAALLWYVQSCLAELDVLWGRPDAAVTRLEPAFVGPHVDWRAAVMLPATLAWAYLSRDEVARADEVVRRAVSEAARRQDLTQMVGALRVQGMVLSQQRRWEKAESTFQEALALAHAMPYPYAEARILVEYGMLHGRRGERNSARKRLEEALDVFQGLGAKKDIERTERALQGSIPET